MANPTKITDIADQAISKLIDETRDKPKVNGLLRSKSSGRLDVVPEGAPETFIVVINNMPYNYDSSLFETPEQISEAIVDLINQPTNILESFEGLTPGVQFNGSRIHGTWVNQVKGYIVQDTDPDLGFKGARTDFGAGLPINAGPPDQLFDAAIFNYVGYTLDAQKWFLNFKIPSAFPGPSLKGINGIILVFSVLFLAQTSGNDRRVTLTYQPDGGGGYEFELKLERTNGVLVDTITIPEAAFVDNQYHHVEIVFDLAGTYYNVDIDSGAYNSTNAIANPIPGVDLAFMGTYSIVSAALTDVPDIYFDDFELGTALDNQTADARGFQIVESDTYFYLISRTPGNEIAVENSENLRFNRLGVIDQLQELENTYFDLLENRAIDTAEGEQLDRIGENLGLTREPGQDDDEYRILLNTQIAANLSNGEAETIIEITGVLTSSTIVKLQELFPAHIVVEFDGDATNQSLLNQQIRRIKAAGVGLTLVKDVGTASFVFEGGDGLGFSSTQDTDTGGILSSKIG